ncbi:hypothetical protein [Desulfogranum marinum]|uniref:hypothetical protein n=1 Tax=Desulfogranum marinum TaxID=453220 RepID=UPI001962EEC4|nr:hypothetical protein [Desulfogranum marinum]MBM9512583.1 hypothetical protein [Desulfogranum marinum]
MVTSHTHLPLETLLACPENLYWAWLKYQQYLQATHCWTDESRLACFEANLQAELDAIGAQFKRLTYRASPIRPLPLPSHDKKRESNGHIFDISIRDQVAWIAFVNVIGPGLDWQMPPWSYGGRLYRSTWEEEKKNIIVSKNGRYRHSDGYLYRNSSLTWSLYQRHIFLTARAMAGLLDPEDLEDSERKVFEQERYFEGRQQLPYLLDGYWPSDDNHRVYRAQLSFNTTLSEGNLSTILDNLANFSTEFKPQIHQLASQLLDFRLDLDDWDQKKHAEFELSRVENSIDSIPEGLAVADFLKNIALMVVDSSITDHQIFSGSTLQPGIQGKNIAHFRFGYNHCFLSRTFSGLVNWVEDYQTLCEKHGSRIVPDWQSVEPRSFSRYWEHGQATPNERKLLEEYRKQAAKETLLDNSNPLPAITRTLRLLTNLTDLNFDLLQQREKMHYIDEMENLLLGHSTGSVINDDFQVDNIAHKLAWSVPQEIIGNQANLCLFERQLFEARLRETSLHKRLKSLRPEAEDAETVRVDIQQVQQKIAELNQEHQLIAAKNMGRQFKNKMRIFLMLLRAVRNNPMKLNLWIYLLEYCRFSGQTDLTLIHKELEALYRHDRLGAGYVWAMVYRLMANQAVQCSLNMSQKDHLIYRRQAAYSYLKTLLLQPVTLPVDAESTFYELHSLHLLQCGLGSALMYLRNADNELVTDDDFKLMEQRVAKCGGIDWTSLPEKWAAETSVPLSVWAWWAETRLNSPQRTNPGPIWKAAVGKFEIDVPCGRQMLFRYPREAVRAVGVKTMIDACLAEGTFYRNNCAGWFYELLQGTSPLRYEKERGLAASSGEKKVCSIVHKDSDDAWMTLARWGEWSNQKYRENAFDPRVTEWTALEIADQIAEKVKSFLQGGNSDCYPLHPLNFLVPTKWIEEGETILTWDHWRDQIREKTFSIGLREAEQITDYRYMFDLQTADNVNPELPMIRGFGLLLLGLVTHSFDWPAMWNVRGHEWQYLPLVSTRMRNVPFSSWTHAILEACLLPRQLETALVDACQQGKYDDDTAQDPPQILDLARFQSCVQKARQVLEEYQMTLQHRVPRQLVPVKLEHFTRPDWATDFG